MHAKYLLVASSECFRSGNRVHWHRRLTGDTGPGRANIFIILFLWAYWGSGMRPEAWAGSLRQRGQNHGIGR